MMPLSSCALYSPRAGVNSSISGKEIRTHITITDAVAIMMSPNFSVFFTSSFSCV